MLMGARYAVAHIGHYIRFNFILRHTRTRNLGVARFCVSRPSRKCQGDGGPYTSTVVAQRARARAGGRSKANSPGGDRQRALSPGLRPIQSQPRAAAVTKVPTSFSDRKVQRLVSGEAAFRVRMHAAQT